MKLLYVKWIDASGPETAGWMNDAELAEHLGRELLITDVGFLVHESKDYISLVSGMSKEPEGSDWSSVYHHLIKIPKVCIKTKRDLTKFLPDP
jgi:hypothetical protein